MMAFITPSQQAPLRQTGEHRSEYFGSAHALSSVATHYASDTP